MAAVYFSLTQDYVINPMIAATGAKFAPAQYDDCAECEYCFNTEIFTRIGAVFISVFAVADACVHFLSALYKTSCFALAQLGILDPADWNSDEIFQHFLKAAFFTGLAVVGPVVGFIYPSVFEHYWYSPVHPSKFFEILAKVKLENGGPDVAWPELKVWFDQGRIDEKILFFKTFGTDDLPEFKRIRELFSENYYKVVRGAGDIDLKDAWPSTAELADRVKDQDPNDPIIQLLKRKAAQIACEISDEPLPGGGEDAEPIPKEVLDKLLADGYQVPAELQGVQQQPVKSTQTVQERIEALFHMATAVNIGLYFHGTKNEANLEGILKTGIIQVRHQQAYRGAFVSTQPEPGYGPPFLALTAPVAFSSHPDYNMEPANAGGAGGAGFWAGLSQDIPINSETLAYVCINGDEHQCEDLAARIKDWTKGKDAPQGLDIPVVPYALITQRLQMLQAHSQVVPAHWRANR